MKRNNKKGFTIVELVIVIAVIAILSAVLIPTFGGIVDKANESARDQEARNLLTEYMTKATAEQLSAGITGEIYVDGYKYDVVAGNIQNIQNNQDDVDSVPEHHLICNDTDCDHACEHTDVDPVDHICDKCGVANVTAHVDEDGDKVCDNGCNVAFE